MTLARAAAPAAAPARPGSTASTAPDEAPDLPARMCAPPEGPQRTLDELELDAIRRAVDEAGGNISVASKRLGISRNTIYRKLRWKPAAR
jgi:transcriptional regulator of acetoin/glycerol metabolism